MQITNDQLEQQHLASLGLEAIQLLCSGEFPALANRFGYALAYDRDPAIVIQEDLTSCLTKLGANALAPLSNPLPKVGYFKQNGTGLIALIEFLLLADNEKQLLVELIVTGNSTEKYLTLEQISVTA